MVFEHDTLSIRPLSGEEELTLLERLVGGEPQGKHRARYERQLRDLVTYLVAWLGPEPAGHVLVRWDRSASREDVPVHGNDPELEDLYVVEARRGRRIGFYLLDAAETLARSRGFHHLGLAVGLTAGFQRARSLYASRGYRSAGFSLTYKGWWTHDADGNPVWWEEAVEYVHKSLDTGEMHDA